jgi:hypothetical protein
MVRLPSGVLRKDHVTAELERKMGDEIKPADDPPIRFSGGLFGEWARRNADANCNAIAFRNPHSNSNNDRHAYRNSNLKGNLLLRSLHY